MKLKDYLKDKLLYFVMTVFLLAFVIVVLTIFEVNHDLIVYVVLVMVCVHIIYLYVDFYKRQKFYNQIMNQIDRLDKKYLISELIEEPHFCEAKLLYEMIYRVCKDANEHVKDYKQEQDEWKEYIESWCHEIKTPLATAKMIIENHHNEITDSIDEELDRINNDIEQVLFYARSQYVEKDYLITTMSLKECVFRVIKRNKKACIHKKIKIELGNLDYQIQSDRKWLEFILHQILTNAIKYGQDNPIIQINAYQNQNNVVLKIKDNGIGIDDNEISRVFDKGFTGKNGRENSQSTGMGLYLCKQLCFHLHHHIEIKSDEGVEVTLIFPCGSYYQL